MRALREIYPDYEGRVAILGIGQDPSENAGDIERFTRALDLPFDLAPYENDILPDYNIIQQSSKVAVDSNGVITYRAGYSNTLSERDWREVLDGVAGG